MLHNNGMDLPHMDGIGGLTVPVNEPLTLINGKHLLHVDLLLDFPHNLYFLRPFLNKDNHKPLLLVLMLRVTARVKLVKTGTLTQEQHTM